MGEWGTPDWETWRGPPLEANGPIVNNNKMDFINDYIFTFVKTIGKGGHESIPSK